MDRPWGRDMIVFDEFRPSAFYRRNSWNLEAANLDVLIIASLWNLTGISQAALPPSCFSNFRVIRKVWTRISRLQDFTRFCGMTSVRSMDRSLVCAMLQSRLGCSRYNGIQRDFVQRDFTNLVSVALDPCLIYDAVFRQTKEGRQAAEPAY